jgi:hypothetical protein
MTLQSTVFPNIGFGVVGELFLEGPLRAQPARLNSADPTLNVVGRAFTIAAGGDATGSYNTIADPAALQVQAGGTTVIAGILANPKLYALLGTAAGGSLAPSLTLPNNTMVELVQESAGLIVSLPAAAAIGDWVYYTNATGALVTTAPGAAAPGASTRLPNGRVTRYGIAAAGLAVIEFDLEA